MVTILFCDVVGSVALAEHLDPEEFLEIINGAFATLTPCVMRHGGTLARLIGDACLAFFGEEATREDDPERAVRAALEMVGAAHAYGEQLARERGITGFAVRVGVNTGLVIVGAIGTNDRFEFTAMGDAVNVAARLQSAAPPGGVLVSHDTYRLVRGRFDAALQPPLSVKGHAEPVTCYLVTRAKPLAFPISSRGVEGIATRMVGREAELVALQNAYLDAFEGRQTRVVTVVGEAGIGKSRLLDEFFTWADLRPEYVYYWRGRATRNAQVTPYGLLRDLFARRFSILDSDNAAAALARFRERLKGILDEDEADIAGHLAGFDFSSSPAVQPLLGTPGFGRLATNALRKALRALWGLGPQAPTEPEAVGDVVLLALEDLHWSDDASLDLISDLVAEAPRARLLIVAAARPELFERRPNWGEGAEAYWRLELRPLSRRGSALLVAEILQRVSEVPAELRDRLIDSADGNPFFLEELVKVLIEDGAIETGDTQWRVRPERLAHARLPSTLSAVLQARLDTLPPVEKLVLQRASVVGRHFWDSLVEELAPEVDDVEAVLAALRSRELVFRREQPAFAGVQEYTFKHAVLQQVTYETVLLQTRRVCHGLVARWIEARAGERLGEYLALIGGHYQAAGDGSQAARWITRAGERAAALGANRDARGFFATALELLPPGDLDGRWQTLAAHDEVVGVLGDSEARQAADARRSSS
jgi:class 3 adenylate cyclase